MRILIIGFCLLCIFLMKVQSKPQITKLFPVKELADFHERTNEIKPLDKFLGKLRATYNFVFNKPEDTSNVEKILSNNDVQPNPEIDALKLILANLITPQLKSDSKTSSETKEFADEERAFGTGNEKQNSVSLDVKKSDNNVSEMSTESTKDDWLDDIEPPKNVGQLELQDDSDDDGVVETTTPSSTLQLPMALGKHLLEWLRTLLGLTYGAYARVAQAVKT